MAKLPGLFAKLLGNYGDDIARGVANYGDDVLGAVANYGDDAARAVANYGDDVAGLVADNAGRAVMSPELLSDDFLDIVDDFANHTPYDPTDLFPEPSETPGTVDLGTGKLFHFGEHGTPEGDLKNSILSKHLEKIDPTYPRSITPTASPSEVPQDFGKLYSFEDYVNFPEQTNFLGDVTMQAQMPSDSVFTLPLKNPIDTSQLVLQNPESSQYGIVGLRPHNNTALGRWFRKQRPDYGIELDINPFDWGT